MSIINRKQNFFHKVFVNEFIETISHWRYIIPFCFIAIGLFGYDFYLTIESKKEEEKANTMKVI